jgi:hypothetical protein
MTKSIKGKGAKEPIILASEFTTSSELPKFELLLGKLDYSIDSLLLVDNYLDSFHQEIRSSSGFLARIKGKKPPNEEILTTIVYRAGSYLGECIRRKLPIDWNWYSYEVWCADDIEAKGLWGDKSLPVEFVLGDLDGTVWTPLNKVYKRIVDGKADDVHFFAQTVISQEQKK